ncbi:MAG: hypothetical protein LC687_00385 [Actinobacteria bacterium]|nr:hypothetical protein [Actinomycetota bacterium]MCA1806327.1 hypothetical protein [Actinomycetota bacterium]
MSSDRKRNARAALHQLGQMSPSLQSVVRHYIEHLEVELPRQKIKMMQLRNASKRLLKLHQRALEGDVAEMVVWDDAVVALKMALEDR